MRGSAPEKKASLVASDAGNGILDRQIHAGHSPVRANFIFFFEQDLQPAG
jgi:hypothetical protein